MVSWPSSLGPQLVGTAEQRQDSRLFSAVDAGPPKIRRRFTAASRYVSVPLRLSGDQKQVFDDFYVNTLQDGSLSFDWEDPTTDAIVTFRARQGTPQFTVISGGHPNGDRQWEGTWDLEILP